MSTSYAQGVLDTLLLRQQRRCVQHRCLTAMPLAVPLPFPKFFARVVTQHGDVLCPGAGASVLRSCEEDVLTTPVLAKLVASAAFEVYLTDLNQAWKQASGGIQGRALLEGWGYSQSEFGDVSEELLRQAALYEEDDDDL